MCILFVYTNSKLTDDGDYSLILASNRDEYYDRPAKIMSPWEKDPAVYGGQDIQGGGTWLAISPVRKKLGVLLNVPGHMVENAKSRGALVADFIMSDENTEDYIASINSCTKDYNGFVLATAEWKLKPIVKAYCNVTNDQIIYEDSHTAFSNSVLTKPLTKANEGKEKFKQLCSRFNKIERKEELIDGLLTFLKCDERYLPDPQLEERQPHLYKEFSSIFVNIPQLRYGTRTHSLVLVTKTGNVDIIEVNLMAPIDPVHPKWEINKYNIEP